MAKNTVRITKELDDLEVRDEDSRQFQGFATVEVKDKDGDIVEVDDLMQGFRTFMRRSGLIHDQHSNRTVGKVLNFQRETRKVDGRQVPGILVTGEIFKDHPADDRVWKEIKEGEKAGLSIGAEVQDTEYDAEQDADRLKHPFLHELSVVTEPANPHADITAVNAVAKSNSNHASKDDDLSDACWDGYTAVGMKPDPDGDGQVPNCVPEDEAKATRALADRLAEQGVDRSTTLKAIYGEDTMTEQESKNQSGSDAADSEELSKEDLIKRIEELEQQVEQAKEEESGKAMSVGDALDEAEETLSDDVFNTLVEALEGDDSAAEGQGKEHGEEDEEDEEEKDLEKTVEETVKSVLEDKQVTKTGRPDGAADTPSNDDVAKEDDGGDEDEEYPDRIKSMSDVTPGIAKAVAQGEVDVDQLSLEEQKRANKKQKLKQAIGKEE